MVTPLVSAVYFLDVTGAGVTRDPSWVFEREVQYRLLHLYVDRFTGGQMGCRSQQFEGWR